MKLQLSERLSFRLSVPSLECIEANHSSVPSFPEGPAPARVAMRNRPRDLRCPHHVDESSDGGRSSEVLVPA